MLGLPLSFLLKEFGTLACLSFGKGRREVFLALHEDAGGRDDRTGNWMESREILEIELIGFGKD